MKRRLMLLTMAALAAAPALFAQNDTGSSTLSMSIGPEAAFAAAFSGTTLSTTGGKFGAYSGTTNFTFKIRTTESTGSGTITVEVTDFGSGGPSVSDLSFSCTAASGTACNSSTAASDSTAVTVVSFGAGAHSSDSGDAGTVAWNLVNRTTTKTGAYTSTATFNISAL